MQVMQAQVQARVQALAQALAQALVQAPVQAQVQCHADVQPIRDQILPTDPSPAACATTDPQGDRAMSEAPAARLTSRLVAQLVLIASAADRASGALSRRLADRRRAR
jgi:hypothetical protein